MTHLIENTERSCARLITSVSRFNSDRGSHYFLANVIIFSMISCMKTSNIVLAVVAFAFLVFGLANISKDQVRSIFVEPESPTRTFTGMVIDKTQKDGKIHMGALGFGNITMRSDKTVFDSVDIQTWYEVRVRMNGNEWDLVDLRGPLDATNTAFPK